MYSPCHSTTTSGITLKPLIYLSRNCDCASQQLQIYFCVFQVFQNFDANSIQDVDENRFEFFKKHVLPNFKGNLMSHTLIFVSSYFDFVRIRNYFKREEESFVQICEYTKVRIAQDVIPFSGV